MTQSLLGLEVPVWDLLDTVTGIVVKENDDTVWIKQVYHKMVGNPGNQTRVTVTDIRLRPRWAVERRLATWKKWNP